MLAVLVAAVSGAGSPARGGEGFALAGVGGSTHAPHAFQGVIYAPWGSLSEAGPVLRLWGKTFGFSYKTDLPDRPDTRIDALGYGVEADAGWQVAGEWGRAALLAGAAWRDHRLSPSDPGSKLDKARVGFSLTADGEWRIEDRFGVMANGSYLTGFDQYWVQARPFLHLGSGWKIGLDLAAWGGPDYSTARAGVFTTGYELPFRLFGRVFAGGEVGVQADLSGKRVAPFAGLHVGILF